MPDEGRGDLDAVATRILPAHIEETIEAIARLHAAHHAGALPLQRLLSRLTKGASHHLFVCVLLGVVVAWVTLNVSLPRLGFHALDEPPFNALQGAMGFAGLVIASLILTTQRRDDELASYREQLTLELSIIAEQKTAKIIELLEELRRDMPSVVDRVDEEANALAQSTDPEMILAAIKEVQGSADTTAAVTTDGERGDAEHP